MIRTLMLALALTVVSAAAWAYSGSDQEQNACRRDVVSSLIELTCSDGRSEWLAGEDLLRGDRPLGARAPEKADRRAMLGWRLG